MFKKLYSIIIALVILTGMITLPVRAEENEEISDFVISLGIINPTIDKPSDYVTRELAAVYVAKMCNINLDMTSDTRYFTDVESESFSNTAINTLVERGVLSVPENHKFNPGAYVSVNEVAKMLASAAGYGMQAEIDGGYPQGYLNATTRMGVTLRAANGKINVAQMSYMIYDTLRSPFLRTDANGKTFSTDKDFTVLANYWDIYEEKGTVQTTPYGSLNQTDSIRGEGYAVINGETYEVSDTVNMHPYLGSYVRYFYEYSSKSGDRKLVYLEDISKEEALNVDIDDFVSFKQNVFTYCLSGKSKTKDITLDNPIIVYNGSVLGTDVAQTLGNLNKGTIKLKDSNNDGKFDVILITDYRNFYVSMIDANKCVIYNRIDNSYAISWEENKSVRVLDDLGKEIEITDIKSDQILSVAESVDRKYLEIIVGTQSVTGQITSTSDDSTREVVVGGTTYKIDKSYFAEFKSIYTLDRDYTLALDHLGQIAYIGEESNSNMQFGFVIDAYNDDVNDSCVLKILKQNSEISAIKVASRYSVDGKGEKTTQKVLELFASAKGGEQQLIRYALSGEEIVKIDTREISENEDETNSMYDIFSESRKTSRWYNSYNLGRKCVITASTPVFYIPQDNTSSETYKVANAAWGLKNDGSYISDAYKINSRNVFADAVVVYYNMDNFRISWDQYPFVIDGFEKRFEDGEIVTVIKGYENATKKEAKIYADSGVIVDKLEHGDVVFFAYDYNGSVTKATGCEDGYQLIFDCSEGPVEDTKNKHWLTNNPYGYMLYTDPGAGNYRGDPQISHGWVVNKKGTVVQFSSFGPDAEYTEAVNLSGLTILVCDKEEKEVKVGSLDNVLDYATVGDKCSEILYLTVGGAGRMAIVYN